MGCGGRAAPRSRTSLALDFLDDFLDPVLGLPLGAADVLPHRALRALDLAFGLELGIVQELARLVLHVAFRLLGLALDLVAIHRVLLARSNARRDQGCNATATECRNAVERCALRHSVTI